MQTHQPDKKKIQRRIFGFLCFVLAIMLMGNQVASIKKLSRSEKPICSISDKKAEGSFNVYEMLFSIKSFSLYDMEDADSQ